MSSISEHLDPKQNSLWWLRNAVKSASLKQKESRLDNEIITSPNKLEINISSSVEELFNDNEDDYSASFEDASEADIGSIIDEINKIASQSPIGNYETPASDKSVEEILKEAEKLYMESSKSFEQLSSKSKTPIDFSIPKSKSSISFRSSLNKSKPTPSPSFPVLNKLNLPSESKPVKSIDSDRTEIQSPEDEEVDLIWEKENEDVNNLEKVPSDHSLDFKEFEDRMSEVDKMKENIDDLLQENINELKENLQEFSKEENHPIDNNKLDNKILEEMLHEDEDPDLQDEAINELNKEIENLKVSFLYYYYMYHFNQGA